MVTGFIQESLCKFLGHLKDYFQGLLEFMKNTLNSNSEMLN